MFEFNNSLLCEGRSGIREMSEFAVNNYDVHKLCFLGYGQPDGGVDQIVVDYIKQLDFSKISYTANQGDPELLNSIVCKFQERKINILTDDVFVTAGATQAISLVLGCLLNNGDEVLTPLPGYPTYRSIVKHYGSRPIYYSLDPLNGYSPNVHELESRINGKTKAIIINSPSNPLGSVISQSVITEIVELANSKNVFVIFDEVYDELIYGYDHFYPISLSRYDNVISIYSVSKVYNLCGLRVGYVLSRNKKLMKIMLAAQEMYASCVNYIGQKAASFALQNCSDYVLSLKEKYIERISVVCDILKDFVLHKPCGAFYVSINIGTTRMRSGDFCKKLLHEHQIALSPGYAFGPSCDFFARISLIAPSEVLQDASHKIFDFISRHKSTFMESSTRCG